MNRNFWYILTFGILLIVVCGILMSPVSAYPRITQGQDVYLNDTIDISGVAAGYSELVWCGAYSDYFAPDNASVLYSMPVPIYRKDFYSFWLDQEIFGNRTGYWYRWNGEYESNANMRAFRVVPGTKHYWYNSTDNTSWEGWEPTITFDNATQIILPPPVPIRHVADFLIARGDAWNTTWNGTAKLWVFGFYNSASAGLYDFPNVNDTFTLRKNQTQNFMPGSYKMVIQSWGNESQNFNARYDPVKDQIEYFNPKIFQVLHVDLKPLGLNQEVRLQKFREIWNYTMDDWKEFNLTVQNPSVEITELSQQSWTENQTYLHLLGYTNVQNGTTLTFILDKEKQTPRTLKYSMFTTPAQGIDAGDMRWFDIAIPLIWENTYVGEHSVTANTSVGGEMKYDYNVWQAPEGSYVPPKMVKYIGGNEYIAPVIQTVTIVLPTPTPEVITRTITVVGAPSAAAVKNAQISIVFDAIWLGLEVIVGIGIIFFGLRFLYRVWKNRRWYEK